MCVLDQYRVCVRPVSCVCVLVAFYFLGIVIKILRPLSCVLIAFYFLGIVIKILRPVLCVDCFLLLGYSHKNT